MSVGSISSLTNIATGASKSSSNSSASQSSALHLDFTTYLKILTVQLQNQDPTNATDPNQFTQELIMMQQVQAQITNNQAIESLTKATTANSLASGVGYIGQYVRSASADGNFSLQDSTAEIGYTLNKTAAAVIINVRDSSGATVATLSGAATSGDNYITWDGKTASGTTAANGAYTFTIAAVDNGGNSISVSNPTALFKVTGVESNSDGTLTLEAGDLSLLSTDVTGVYSSMTKPVATAGTLITPS